MSLSAPLLRRIHKWIGLILGLQFVIWTVSGATMALLDMDTVAGGKARTAAASPALPLGGPAWRQVQRSLSGQPVTGVAVRPLMDRQVLEVATPAGVRLFDAADGRPVRVDGPLARRVAEASYAGGGKVSFVAPLREVELAVREHKLPIWRVDFADAANSSFYVSGATGKLLERRNDTWRIWDFAWMLHNMDYVSRTSFNHPLIIVMAFGIIWLAITGFWLLFRTKWKPDLRRLARLGATRRSE
ncbi:MAG TPA: PepSY domain-containing protein [Allosphingosinicella sp.]